LASGTGSVAMRSMAQRNAANVFPEPVGAQMSVCEPAAIDGHPSRCAAVGARNDDSNHAREAGEKDPRLTESRYRRLRQPYVGNRRRPLVSVVA
jgi:hypothetical protein